MEGGVERNGRETDWAAIEQSTEFRELTARRRRFLIPATVFFLTFFLGYLLLAAYAQGFMGKDPRRGPRRFPARAHPGAADLADHLAPTCARPTHVRAARTEGREGRGDRCAR